MFRIWSPFLLLLIPSFISPFPDRELAEESEGHVRLERGVHLVPDAAGEGVVGRGGHRRPGVGRGGRRAGGDLAAPQLKEDEPHRHPQGARCVVRRGGHVMSLKDFPRVLRR